jgi:hypothetical protein
MSTCFFFRLVIISTQTFFAIARTLGESYAAAWTAKHSEQALKAEPPDGWPVPPAVEGNSSCWHDSKAALKAEAGLGRAGGGEYARLGSVKIEPGLGGRDPMTPGGDSLDDYGQSRKPSSTNEISSFSLVESLIKTEAVGAAGDYYGAVSSMSPRIDPMDRLKSRPGADLETGKSSRYRSPSRDRSPGYSYARSRDGSMDRNRYRSRSSSREGSREAAYRRRSYDGSLADPYHPRSRDISPERDRYREA